MRTIKVDKRSKFAVELTFTNESGEVIDPNVIRFKFIYLDSFGGNPYEVSRTETESFINSYIKESRLYALFQDFKFRPGRLTREIYLNEEIIPDQGSSFIDNTMKIIKVESSVIEITDGINYTENCTNDCINGCCLIGVENFRFPCTYSGIDPDQCSVIVNDFIQGKDIVAKAITDKGVPADSSDSMVELSNKIRQIEPAVINIEINSNIDIFCEKQGYPNPYDIMRDNFDEQFPHMVLYMFRSDIGALNLNVAEKYVLSDGRTIINNTQTTIGRGENLFGKYVICYYANRIVTVPRLNAENKEIGVATWNVDISSINITSPFLSYFEMDENSSILSGSEIVLSNSRLHQFIVRSGNEFSSAPTPIATRNIDFQGQTQLNLSTRALFNMEEVKFSQELEILTLGNSCLQGYTGTTMFSNNHSIKQLSFGTYPFSNITSITDFYLPKTIESCGQLANNLFLNGSTPSRLILEKGFNYSLNVQWTTMGAESIVFDMLDKLIDLSSGPAKILTIGSNNIAKLTNIYVTYDANKNITGIYDTSIPGSTLVIDFINQQKNWSIA